MPWAVTMDACSGMPFCKGLETWGDKTKITRHIQVGEDCRPTYMPRRNNQQFLEEPEAPAPLLIPVHRAPCSVALPSFLLKAFNKDFIFPPTLAAVRRSLYNLLGWEEGERHCPAPRRWSGVDPGSGRGRLGTACLQASLGMPDPACW